MNNQKQSWNCVTWNAVDRQNRIDAAQWSFTRKIEWVEKMTNLLRQSKLSGTATRQTAGPEQQTKR